MYDRDIQVAVIGGGYWGKNLVRNFHRLGVLRAVCDLSENVRDIVLKSYPGVTVTDNSADVFADPSIHACVIATPAESHFRLVVAALAAGKDVLVEKPLALRVSEAEQLVDIAQRRKKILMVGHLIQYHPAFECLTGLAQAEELGRIDYAYANRLSLGKIRREENALWSFAPHDISLILGLFQEMPIQVTAVGGAYLQATVADVTLSTMLFENGSRAHFFVSWLHPYKEQKLVLVGTKKMAVFNDTAGPQDKLRLFEKGVNLNNGEWTVSRDQGTTVTYPDVEPLLVECRHFLESVQNRSRPRTDGYEGLRVLRVLQCCQRSLQMNGEPVHVLAQIGELLQL